jgi:1-aminocyclopropane-1-carboxylate deaminase/D-cysteine desulfhydrase-like pyridoxal-dependent ACC family enzyme
MNSGETMSEFVTPITPCPRLGRDLGIDLRVKRDDLFPMTGGGSKARKLRHILREVEGRCDALVTTGGVQSNHARVVALAAAARGWRCGLVLHGDPAVLEYPQGNLRLALLTGAEVQVVEPLEIAAALAARMAALAAEGCRPHLIPGGGHCLSGTLAYVEAVAELAAQCRAEDWTPDVILHASGTGTTQAGLLAGVQRAGWPTRVIGISVARRNPRGRGIVAQAYEEAGAHLSLPPQPDTVDVRDDWIGEGYEHAVPALWHTIHRTARTEGLILDPTYTGKAFTALLEMAGGEIPEGSRVLFWHTGGLMNLLAVEMGGQARTWSLSGM